MPLVNPWLFTRLFSSVNASQKALWVMKLSLLHHVEKLVDMQEGILIVLTAQFSDQGDINLGEDLDTIFKLLLILFSNQH